MRPLHTYISETELQRKVDFALSEDIGEGDITTEGALGKEQLQRNIAARLVAKSDGILSGRELFKLTLKSVEESTVCNFSIEDGKHFSAGDVLAEITGPAGAILQAERTALNFTGKLSGIAALTGRYVAAVSHTKCRILDTRKTTPGWRTLEKYAVNCGGAVNHRIGLFDMALIKENHISAAGSIAQAIENVRQYLETVKKPGVAIEVEIQNGAELKVALQAKVDRVLLDNQSADELSKLVTTAREISASVELEASGNITLTNVANYAETGVDFVSIGALTHSAATADLSLLISN
jgi:nicotinate-nucleotide pyrophosphorylase (carboxylating)